MATKPKYQADAQYDVVLSEVVFIGRRRLLPRPDLKHRIKGAVLETIAPEAIASAAKAD